MFSPYFQPRRPIGTLRGDLDAVFNTLLHNSLAPRRVPSTSAARFPQVNVQELTDTFVVEAELPGVNAANIEVVVLGNELTLKGERTLSGEDATRVYRRERPSGKFLRVLQFPCELDANDVKAELKNGVLTVTLSKAAAARPKKITITAS